METLLLWIIAFILATWMFGVLGSAVLLVVAAVLLVVKAKEEVRMVAIFRQSVPRLWLLILLVVTVALAVVAMSVAVSQAASA